MYPMNPLNPYAQPPNFQQNPIMGQLPQPGQLPSYGGQQQMQPLMGGQQMMQPGAMQQGQHHSFLGQMAPLFGLTGMMLANKGGMGGIAPMFGIGGMLAKHFGLFK